MPIRTSAETELYCFMMIDKFRSCNSGKNVRSNCVTFRAEKHAQYAVHFCESTVFSETRSHLVPGLGIRGAIPPLLHTPAWNGA